MLTLGAFWRLFTPAYFFRPQQIFNRLWRELPWRTKGEVTVRLPWGLPLTIDPNEAIGYNISTRGVYETVVTETLWRLAAGDELAVDAGANIGYTASVLAARLGSNGLVLCFEPHPVVFAHLEHNVARWAGNPRCAKVELHQQALGARDGEATLQTAAWFDKNRGTASICKSEAKNGGRELSIEIVQLDTIAGEHANIGVLKIDVEGAELDVLCGMSRLLANHSVRDILFEENRAYPAPTHEYLRANGYSIFALEEGFWGVRLMADATPQSKTESGPPNYLATCDSARARRLLDPPFWRSFGFLKFIANR